MRKANKKINLGIIGVAGKMGKSIVQAALLDNNINLSAGSEHTKSKMIGTDLGSLIGHKNLGVKVTSDKTYFCKDLDIMIEFGLEQATLEYLPLAKKNKIAFISGSTALSTRTLNLMKSASKVIPVFWAPNMSLGANLLKMLAEKTAMKIAEDFDVDIIDLHHKLKKDTPSGTAVLIKDALDNILRKKKLNKKKSSILAMRSGDSTGEHSVIFSGLGERIEIKHISSSRQIFASGAVKVATWVYKKKPGLYDMSHFLKI